MMLKSLLALSVLVVAPAAENWVQMGTTPIGVVISVDVNSITRQGNVSLIWERHSYANVDEPRFGEIRTQSAYDCAARSVVSRQAIVYDRGGMEKQRIVWNEGEAKVRPVEAGTIGETMFKRACGLS